MAEPLKVFFSDALVKRMGAEMARAHPSFPMRTFTTRAKGLDELELLDRARHIANALAAALPAEYPAAVDVILRSLGPEHGTDELVGVGMSPFFYMPHTIFVAERGLDHFDLSMRAQYELTKRFTAEFSVRPFIAKDPDRAFETFTTWTTDESAHVRRLVSEGTRLRLPWGTRVAWLDANPERILALLERLKDDSSTLVRRSVANNLNDLGKVWPELLHRTCAAWLKKATPERRQLVEHALRSAVKRSDPRALALLGYGKKPKVSLASVTFTPKKIAIGERVTVKFTLKSEAREAQELLVDLAVHFVKASGKAAPKVFKLKRVVLPARGEVSLETRVSLAVHTTRVPRAGKHVVDVIVNGEALRAGAFAVVAQRS